MADASLDDFFAKKDKSKKGKSKAKYTTSETIAKKLEEGGKKPESIYKKDIKDRILSSSTNNQSISIPSTLNASEDDEWKNIEEKERDYSGLRIQALSISEKEKEEEQLKEQLLSEQNGESAKQTDGQSGPWRVNQGPAEEEEKPPQPVPKKVETSKPTGAYKPPALRNPAPSTGSATRRHPKNAPQITSNLDFPSLSSALESNKGKCSDSDRGFQAVKHGFRSKGEVQQDVQLSLENKFAALNQGD